MELKALSLQTIALARQWRNQQLEMLRTPFLLTIEQQEKFYHDVICNRQANARYWGIWETKKVPPSSNLTACNPYNYLIGMCGLENISWENRNAEISFILNPEYTMDKYGKEALQLLLHEGFSNMNLDNIYTEVYECSPHKQFWIDAFVEHKDNEYATIPTLPNRKYYNGKYYNSLYINFNKERFNESTIS